MKLEAFDSDYECLIGSGYTIIKDVLDKHVCDSILSIVYNELEHNTLKSDEFKRDIIGDQNREHGTLPWRENIINDAVFKIINRTYKYINTYLTRDCHDFVELGFMCLHPGGVKQGEHVDISPSKPGEYLTFLIYLTECSKENGATRLFPGTRPRDIANLDINDITSTREPVVAEGNIGDILIYDSRLVHNGGENTTNKDRVVMNFTFGPRSINTLNTNSTNHDFQLACEEGQTFLIPQGFHATLTDFI